MIDDDIKTVLLAAKRKAGSITLPPGLDPALHKRVVECLEQLGAKWNRWKGCHILDAEAEKRLDGVLC